MTDKERMVAIMRGGSFSNYPELADLLIADGCGYDKSFNYTAAINEQDQERIRQLEEELTKECQEHKQFCEIAEKEVNRWESRATKAEIALRIACYGICRKPYEENEALAKATGMFEDFIKQAEQWLAR